LRPREDKMIVIKAKNLEKIFKVPLKEEKTFLKNIKNIFYRKWIDKVALKNVSFEIKKGEFIGYIGPNGAGKSTTIKMMTGIISPSRGSVKVLNFNPHKDRYQYSYNIGVVFGQRRLLQYDIPVMDSFRLYKDIYELSDHDFEERINYFNRILNLKEYLHIPVRKLSLGERMRCEIAAALLHKPKVVFLDEPTIGLDAIAKEEIRSFLKEINKNEGVTIILTTHDMDDIEELCEKVIIIDKGEKVYDGSLSKLKKSIMHHKTIEVDFKKVKTDLFNKSIKKKGIEIIVQRKTYIKIRVDTSIINVPGVIKELFNSLEVIDLVVHEPKLEHVIKEIYEKKIQSPKN
jgi:ABC-2 type transport system ATP-binding protein